MNTSLYACGPPSWLPGILKRASQTPVATLIKQVWEMPCGDVIRKDADAIAYTDVFTASLKSISQICHARASQSGSRKAPRMSAGKPQQVVENGQRHQAEQQRQADPLPHQLRGD